MFLGNWGDDESRMEVNEGLSQGRELGIASSDFQILYRISFDDLIAPTVKAYPSPYRVDNEAAAALMVLPGVSNDNRHLGVLVEDLLYPAIINTLPGISLVLFLDVISLAVVVVGEIGRVRNVVGSLVGGLVGGRAGFTIKGSFTS